MRTHMRASTRVERLASAIRAGLLRLVFGKNWACAVYQRRRERLAGPRPGARLH